MNPKKAVRELERQLRKQPDSIVLRIRLASALQAIGRVQEAVGLYRRVAMTYFAEGWFEQATAMCHSVLEIAPMDEDIRRLLVELAAQGLGAAQAGATDTQVAALGSEAAPGWPKWEAGDRPAPGGEPGLVPDPSAPPRSSHDTDGPATGENGGPVSRRTAPPWGDTLDGAFPPQAPPGRGDASSARSARPGRDGSSMTGPTPQPALPVPTDLEPPPPPPGMHGSLPLLPLAGRNGPPRATRASSVHRAPRPRGSSAMPAYPARSARVSGSHAGERAAADVAPAGETAEHDDERVLARALERSYGMSDDSGLEAEGTLPLLSRLSERSVEAIAAGMVRRRVASGELIVREGEVGDSCFVLARGEARVLKRDPLLPRGDLVEVSRLTDGDLFGEVAMVGDRRRHASVQAVSDCELREVPRDHLMLVSRRFPEVEAFLQQFYRERLIATLISTASFFRPLDVPQRTSLLSLFRFSHVEAGTVIVEEGERAGGFFLIVLGSVEITKRISERKQVLLATLGEGTYFGEMALLRGEAACASVTATEPLEVAMLPATNFYDLVASYPVLWDQVRQEAHRREVEMVQIIAGVTGTV